MLDSKNDQKILDLLKSVDAILTDDHFVYTSGEFYLCVKSPRNRYNDQDFELR